MKKDTLDTISALEKSIGYNFHRKELAIRALTHPSLNEGKLDISNERLEFLGDSVLSMLITEALYLKLEDDTEGSLSQKRARLVSSAGICLVAEKLELQNFLFLSRGEEKSGGRENAKNLENAMEAIIGAIYIDGGLIEAKNFVLLHWKDYIENSLNFELDPKSKLQQWSQINYGSTPEYSLLLQTGTNHAPIFEIEVKIEGFGSCAATGKNKKEAEKNAALKFLNSFVNIS